MPSLLSCRSNNSVFFVNIEVKRIFNTISSTLSSSKRFRAMAPRQRIVDPRGGGKSSAANNNPSRCCNRGEGPNVIIMSAAGKPIFVRYGNEDEWATACGIIQGLRANVMSFGTDGPGEEGASSLGDVLSVIAGLRPPACVAAPVRGGGCHLAS